MIFDLLESTHFPAPAIFTFILLEYVDRLYGQHSQQSLDLSIYVT